MDTIAGGNAPDLPLIGGVGSEFVANTLTTTEPQAAIREIQDKGALPNPLCRPLLGLVDQLGVTRSEVHRAILDAAKASLLKKIQTYRDDKTKLERLLNNSFPYLGIPELRCIPIACMEELAQVRQNFLKQLTVDKQVFKDLPAKVQRQVWEYDKNLLQQDALPLVGSYNLESSFLTAYMSLNEFLVSSGGAPALSHQSSLVRKKVRKDSKILQQLKVMVGTSSKIYNQINELCIVKYRDSDPLCDEFVASSYCSLRAQLLMTLHDDNSAVSEKDSCHQLAWTVDAGVNAKKFTEKHVQNLEKYFGHVEDKEGAGDRELKRRKLTVEDEAESAGGAFGTVVEPRQSLGHAGMILREPSAFHLLLAQVIDMLHQVVNDSAIPSSNKELVFVLRLLQLAVNCQQMLRDRRFHFPQADPFILTEFLPTLACHMLDSKQRTTGGDRGLVNLTSSLANSELACMIGQVFIIDRFQSNDYETMLKLLKPLTTISKPFLHQASFSSTLAKVAASMLTAGKLSVNSEAWSVSLGFLCEAATIHPLSKDDVLQLLFTASTHLKPAQLVGYLETLENSANSWRKMRSIHSSSSFKSYMFSPEDVPIPAETYTSQADVLPNSTRVLYHKLADRLGTHFPESLSKFL